MTRGARAEREEPGFAHYHAAAPLQPPPSLAASSSTRPRASRPEARRSAHCLLIRLHPRKQPVQLTVYADQARPLTYAAAYGSGDVVIAPGAANGSAFEAAGGLGGGRVIARGVNATSVTVTSSG